MPPISVVVNRSPLLQTSPSSKILVVAVARVLLGFTPSGANSEVGYQPTYRPIGVEPPAVVVEIEYDFVSSCLPPSTERAEIGVPG